MADKKVEPAGEPKAEPKAEPKVDKDIDGFLAELEKAGVTNPEQLQGKLKASKEAGQLANILGTVRSENQELKELIKGLQKTSKQSDEWDTSAQPVDLDATIERTLERVLSKKEKAQAEQQARFLTTYNKIVGNKNYHLVKEVWEGKLKDPNFNFQLQSGQVDPTEAFNDLVLDYYVGISKKAGDVIRSMKTGTITPPHMEGEGAVEKSKQLLPETKEKTKALQEKVNKGYLPTDEELIALMG
uniref:Uncharacterized protein n=1 Tax=viral metagenome TaxID=1070528 RepID=A0A6H1ZGP0_9ZZZZ